MQDFHTNSVISGNHMARNKYRPRIADKLLQTELLSAGAVLVEGAKWCGKTRTAEQAARSIVYMQDQDMADNYLQMAETMPSLLLEGEEPHLIDECWSRTIQLHWHHP